MIYLLDDVDVDVDDLVYGLIICPLTLMRNAIMLCLFYNFLELYYESLS